jgi:uncharacterized protein YbjT (DUF2867 family)
MILVVGASGRLGGTIARHLLSRGERIRVLTRTPAKLEHLKALGAEVVGADLRDPASLSNACQGVAQVLTTAHAGEGKGTNDPRSVDGAGNRHLIDAAKAAGVRHFVFISTHSAQPDSPVDLFRFKYQTEVYLRASDMPFTILRPTHLMDSWIDLFGQSILKKQEATIFGRGTNPVNFVAIEDVARLAALVLEQPEARNWTVEIGGPENLTLHQVVEAFERVLHLHVKVRHLPVPTLRTIRLLMRPFNPVLSRQLGMAILLDSGEQSCDMTETLKLFPLHLTRLEEFIQARYASSALQQPAMPEGANWIRRIKLHVTCSSRRYGYDGHDDSS